jgi:dTDP-4-dehydrorhamnose reductase
MKKKILITGANGMLGSALQKILKDNDEYEAYYASRQKLNITIPDHVRIQLKHIKPDIIINLAARTNVDKCESSFLQTYLVNTVGANYIGMYAPEDARIIHVSTSAIFGKHGNTMPEIDFNKYDPPNKYAQSKLLGEWSLKHHVTNRKDNTKLHIVRAGWIFSGGENDHKFIGKIYNKIKNNEPVDAVDDVRGQPIYVDDLAAIIKHIVNSDNSLQKVSISHAGSQNSASRKDIADLIKRSIGSSSVITGVPNSKFNLRAERPLREYIGLQKTEINLRWSFRTWEEMLTDCLNNNYK